jgi:hypothetical protein
LLILENCHNSDTRLYNEQGFPESTRGWIRKYLGHRQSVSVQLDSPPVRDLKDSGCKVTTGQLSGDVEEWTEQEDVVAVDEANELADDVHHAAGINIDDLLSSDDEDESHGEVGSNDQLSPSAVDPPPVTSAVSDPSSFANNIDYEDNDIGEPVGPHIIWANASQYSCQAMLWIRIRKNFESFSRS